MGDEKCETCRFWTGVGKKLVDGKCRRLPPQVVVGDGDYEWSSWPATAKDEWCGEWQPRRLDAKSN